MKIVQVVPHYVPAYRFGGPLQVAHSLSRAFIQLGHSVIVCTTNQANKTENLDVAIDIPTEVDNVTVYYESVNVLRYWGFSIGLWRRASREIAKADIILIHAHYQFANWIAACLARYRQKPYIIFAHGSLHSQGVHHKSSWIKYVYLQLLEKRNLQKALFIAFNAPEEKQYSLFKELGKVVSSGIDPTEFKYMPTKGSFREIYPNLKSKTLFLFLGRLDVKHKGLDLLIPAFAETIKKYPDIHLVLAGPDEDGGKEKIEELARQHRITKHIMFTGLLAGNDKLAALQDSDVFVLPSRFEGLSIALLEALYIGLPVLVTDTVGMHKEVQRLNAGIVVSVNDRAIENALNELCNSKLRNAMRGQATQLIEQEYTWNAIASKLILDIQQII